MIEIELPVNTPEENLEMYSWFDRYPGEDVLATIEAAMPPNCELEVASCCGNFGIQIIDKRAVLINNVATRLQFLYDEKMLTEGSYLAKKLRGA